LTGNSKAPVERKGRNKRGAQKKRPVEGLNQSENLGTRPRGRRGKKKKKVKKAGGHDMKRDGTVIRAEPI